jgi:hypothetical protein
MGGDGEEHVPPTDVLARVSLSHPRLDLPGYVELVYALVAVWGAGDVLSTYAAVSASGGTGMEVHPWMELLLDTEPVWSRC